MRNDIDDRRDEPFFTSGVMVAIVFAILIAGALLMWAPWTGSRVADNSAPGVTTGQSSSTPRVATPVTTPVPAPVPAPAPTK